MALGKGMDAFFDDIPVSPPRAAETGDCICELKISEVEPRSDQPRKNFDREQLQILANSIAQHGVIQPIIVTRNKNGTYSIIAGERRWRASRIAGKATIPAVIRSYDELAAAEVSLIENLQREDLNPIEEAMGYRSLMEQFSLTQEKVAEKVGKSRSAVANALRLLSLEEEIQKMLIEGTLSSGHARALLAIEDGEKRLAAAERAAREGLSVREMEDAARESKKRKPAPKRPSSPYPDVENDLKEKFGTKVKISGEGRGKIELFYYSEEDLIRIIDMMEQIK